MITPLTPDLRLDEAYQKINNGSVRLLSLDVFDTLIFRKVPRPPDVFLCIGKDLEKEGLLVNGQGADSFAAIRYQTEYARRAIRQNTHDDREITLDEIYEHFPKNILKHHVSPQALTEREIAKECSLCLPNMEMALLASYAKDKGCRLAIISNTYFDEAALRRILSSAYTDFPTPDFFLVSSVERMGKRTGLMKKLVDLSCLPADHILHIGDNPISDKLAAEETGIPFIDYGAQEAFEALITDEQPRQWWQRANCYGTPQGDLGITQLRKHIFFHKLPETVSPELAPYYRYGQRHIAPLLNIFTRWAAARLEQEKAARVFGLLREGDFLTELFNTHKHSTQPHRLALSRISTALAAFVPERPENLEDFVTRRGFWTVGMLMAQLGFTEQQARIVHDPCATLQTLSPKELTQKILVSSLIDQLYDSSRKRRKNLLRHLEEAGALKDQKLYVLDLGYAATIQRNLQRILDIEGYGITTHGLYMTTAHVSLGTQLAGGIVEGFLAQNGNPNDFACAFCRAPEVIEISCMPSYGSVSGHKDDGSPIFADDAMPSQQYRQARTIQQACLDFSNQIGKAAPADFFLSSACREQMRALAMRIITHPTPDEVELLGSWLADSDMGLASPRPIVSAGSHQDRLSDITPSELASLPRRDVPWIFGVATSISHAHNRQVARLILQHERPEAFKIQHASTCKDDA